MPEDVLIARSYGCTLGCGNPYDYVIVDIQDGTTQFLCVPCFVKTATDMVEAITNPENPLIQKALAEAGVTKQAPMTGNGVRKRGHNAPATTDDEDLLEAYSSVITEDDLPDEFK